IDQMISYAAQRSPLPRGISPEEVANAAVFLCSPLASAITAQVLYVDCGYSAMGVKMPRERPNPFYFLLLLASLVFVLTALAYAVGAVHEEKAKYAGDIPPL